MDWLATPASVRELVDQLQSLQEENNQLRHQLTALASDLAGLRELIDRKSRNSSKPPSSDGQGFKTRARRRGSGRQRVGQQGHHGSGPELLPVERCDAVVDHHPEACRHCGTLLQGVDPEPYRHQVIEIPPINAQAIEHRLHRLICPCCGTSTCAQLPAEVESSRFGHRLSALVGLLGSALPLSISKTQALLDQLLGVSISSGAIAAIRSRLAACLQQPVEEALQAARQQPVVYMDETGAPSCNADGCNPDGRRGWLFSAYDHLPLEQRQLCWAHLIRDLTAIEERPGASGEIGTALLALQRQLFEQWHHWKDGQINREQLQESCEPIPAAISRRCCSGWWLWAAREESERPGPTRCAPASNCCSEERPSGRFWSVRRQSG